MYLGRYGKQDAPTLMTNTSTVQLMAWVDELGKLMDEENKATKGK